MSFDTTSSNTGLIADACVLLEQKLDLLQTLEGFCLINPKEKAIKISFNGSNYFLFSRPETIEEVLKSYNTINKHRLYNGLHSLIGTGLITSSYKKWKARRKMLNPAFHFRILEDFQEIFYRKSETLVQKLENKRESEVFDIIQLTSRCTLDVITESAMGIHVNAQDDSNTEYVQAVERIDMSPCPKGIRGHAFRETVLRKRKYFEFARINFVADASACNITENRSIRFLLTPVISAIRVAFEKNLAELLSLVFPPPCLGVSRKRKELIKRNQHMDDFQVEKNTLGIKKKRVFLDLLLFHHLTDKTLSEKDVKEEVDTFMIDGFHTVTVGIGWTLYLLGLHQDIQEKVFEELKGIFADEKNRMINTEDLRKMNYLECVIKESNRIYPPVPLILRRNVSEMKVGDFILPPNSSIMINIHALHHNPTVYENPEIFHPDRFLPENFQKRHPYAFLPFSAGPRNCIGQKFATMEMKTVLANVIRNFRVYSLDPRDKMFESLDVVLRPKYGIRMYIKRR
ncbi:cytochrome P450 4V2-like [Centruroides sculpturatus]|uniref:cytochrome P450 4V2-like n=1 Tax=Centruroides sculpturatus TaxID=218467 RepID=UPI000C6D0489|nr:cytochrome P450 4V2-like [Centruroides sculpturatus]